MPKLLSRSKHEEFESNSSLQIRSYKERRAKSEEQCTTIGMLFLRALFLPPSTVPSCSPCSPAFHAFVVFVTFFDFSLFYPCCNHLCLDCMVFHLVCKAI